MSYQLFFCSYFNVSLWDLKSRILLVLSLDHLLSQTLNMFVYSKKNWVSPFIFYYLHLLNMSTCYQHRSLFLPRILLNLFLHETKQNANWWLIVFNNYSQLVINANMKNTDNHISLLAWSEDDDKSEAAIVDKLEIDRPKWIPKIELQGTSKLIIILVAFCLSLYPSFNSRRVYIVCL